jgi:hypothetical protein
MSKNPLCEVFGFPVENMTEKAHNHRRNRLCPFHNPTGANCTKTSVADPLGTCSIYDAGKPVITCPVRFRDEHALLTDATDFFFPESRFVSISEARLIDGDGKSAGNIDIVLASLSDEGKVKDYGAIEIQAVYISGNVRSAFRHYMADPEANQKMDWPAHLYPRPDYLSSSRKRLVPQLMFKGKILKAWGKKMAVVVQEAFFNQLPDLQETDKSRADMAWLIYDLVPDAASQTFKLQRKAVKYTLFESAINRISVPHVGEEQRFLRYLQHRIDERRLTSQPEPSAVEPTIEPVSGDVLSDKD